MVYIGIPEIIRFFKLSWEITILKNGSLGIVAAGAAKGLHASGVQVNNLVAQWRGCIGKMKNAGKPTLSRKPFAEFADLAQGFNCFAF